MKITIITACLNAEEFIADCMDSVADQSHSDIEHLIIDGASTDGTLAAIKSKENANVRLVSEADGGIYHALNKGLELASGHIVGFLHADDLFESNSVLASVASTLSDPGYDACYADLVYVKRDDPGEVVRFWKSETFSEGMFLRGWMPPHPTFFAKSSVYQKLGGFDTQLEIGADWEFLLRFFEIEKLDAAYVPEIWTRMRVGGISNRSFANILQNNLETWRSCRSHFGLLPSLLFPLRKAIHRLKQLRSF